MIDSSLVENGTSYVNGLGVNLFRVGFGKVYTFEKVWDTVQTDERLCYGENRAGKACIAASSRADSVPFWIPVCRTPAFNWIASDSRACREIHIIPIPNRSNVVYLAIFPSSFHYQLLQSKALLAQLNGTKRRSSKLQVFCYIEELVEAQLIDQADFDVFVVRRA
jgi:hypothetical protein